jgi:hypothetical protein
MARREPASPAMKCNSHTNEMNVACTCWPRALLWPPSQLSHSALRQFTHESAKAYRMLRSKRPSFNRVEAITIAPDTHAPALMTETGADIAAAAGAPTSRPRGASPKCYPADVKVAEVRACCGIEMVATAVQLWP